MSIEELILSHIGGEVSKFSGKVTLQHLIDMRSITFTHEGFNQATKDITDMTMDL